MAHDATLHIKVNKDLALALRKLAQKRKQTMGQLVRQALNASYQADFLGLSQQQKEAVAAFRGGYISVGKLAHVMGLPVVKMREWLDEHGIPQNNSYGETDAANA